MIRNVALEISLRDVICGVLPFVAPMRVAVLLCCLPPGIVIAFPSWVTSAPVASRGRLPGHCRSRWSLPAGG